MFKKQKGKQDIFPKTRKQQKNMQRLTAVLMGKKRGGIGIKAAKIDENSRGSLVSALVLFDSDEILAITSAGTVMRTPAAEVRQTGRDSMGVRLVNLDIGATLLSVTRNSEDEISTQK